MTHVWTNGSQWSYLLIQPHYFTNIKYVCPDPSLHPNPKASQQRTNQEEDSGVVESLGFSNSDITVTQKQGFRNK